jgi:hypothetical protein
VRLNVGRVVVSAVGARVTVKINGWSKRVVQLVTTSIRDYDCVLLSNPLEDEHTEFLS